MVNSGDTDVTPTALVSLRATASEDTPINGYNEVDFILPSGQIGGRSFAVQLFHESTGRRNRHTDTFIGSFGKYTTTDTTVQFQLSPPQVTIKKDETWLLVLYAIETPHATSSPSPTATPSSAPSPSPSASP